MSLYAVHITVRRRTNKTCIVVGPFGYHEQAYEWSMLANEHLREHEGKLEEFDTDIEGIKILPILFEEARYQMFYANPRTTEGNPRRVIQDIVDLILSHRATYPR